jgi:hypothetical protein
MNEVPESELWECSTCKQPHPIETDYECASCGMLASEHISVTAMCRIIREWQSRAYSAELKLARIERERDEARTKHADEKALADRLAMSAQVLGLTLNAFTEGMASEIGADSLRQWREARSPK